MVHLVQFEQWVPVPIERVFLFFANPGNLPRIMPPQTGTELVRLKLVPPPGIPQKNARPSRTGHLWPAPVPKLSLRFAWFPFFRFVRSGSP